MEELVVIRGWWCFCVVFVYVCIINQLKVEKSAVFCFFYLTSGFGYMTFNVTITDFFHIMWIKELGLKVSWNDLPCEWAFKKLEFFLWTCECFRPGCMSPSENWQCWLCLAENKNQHTSDWKVTDVYPIERKSGSWIDLNITAENNVYAVCSHTLTGVLVQWKLFWKGSLYKFLPR